MVSFAQNKESSKGELHGNLDINSQYYFKDEKINAEDLPEKLGVNSYLNLNYRQGNFEAGIRLESYQPALLGFSRQYNGNGMPYRFAKYTFNNELEVTIGNFYEQFGNGQVFRTYFEPGLGVDNSLDGVRVKYNSKNGIYLKGVFGQQRFYFDKSSSIVRGIDGEVLLNQVLPLLKNSKTRFKIGGSLVSKYQKDENLSLTIPENNGAYSGRFQINRGGLQFSSEYSIKESDPNARNGFSYRNGQVLTVSLGYSKKGFGANLSAHTLDNMGFRSDRNNSSLFPELDINYIPALTKQHTYNLLSTLYPYATQPNGEFAVQGDLIFKIKKGTKLGGKYGWTIAVNGAFANSIKQDSISNPDAPIDSNLISIDPKRNILKANMFSVGDEKYFHDFNIEISKKINKKIKTKFTYANIFYNKLVMEGKEPSDLMAHVVIADVLYKFNRKNALRTEIQGLFTDQDKGSWATIVLEYTYSPHWFISFQDQWNYGNKDVSKQIHYPFSSIGYIKKATRVELRYGRQREGIFCIGGVCRSVPASNGVSLAITSTF